MKHPFAPGTIDRHTAFSRRRALWFAVRVALLAVMALTGLSFAGGWLWRVYLGA